MKRWLFVTALTLTVAAATLLAGVAAPSGATGRGGVKQGRGQKAEAVVQKAEASVGEEESPGLKVTVEQVGPTQEKLDAASAQLARQVQRYLRGTRSRMISFDLVLSDEKSSPDLVPPTRYRGTFYDYTNNLTLVAESSFDAPDKVVVTTSAAQPLPSTEEMDAALAVLKEDETFGPALADGRLQVYQPMPPLYLAEQKRERPDRAVNVGLMAADPLDKSVERPNEVVAVNLSNPSVIRFAEGAPPTSKAAPAPAATCGSASGGGSTGRGVAGQYHFVIMAGDGTPLWDFLAIRPSASSGADASGIELQKVQYKGRLLLKRAHVPILNVQYDGNTCGPYRDWEYSESQFNADPTGGTNVAAGVRSCTVPATTQLDTGVDTGNHQGIAFYKQGDAVVLVSEMSAGWYRYISEWSFDVDGTIRPRFGMGATANSCTCNGHIHHAYWRFDFDIDTASPNRVYEPNTEIPAPGPIHPPTLPYILVPTEGKRYRKAGQSWLITNPSTGHSYQLIANNNDGSALTDTYGAGDVWFLSYSATEIDDSAVRTSTAANLDAFANNQSINGTDLVVWYAIHVGHNHSGAPNTGEASITGELVAGPDLVPLSWDR
jgi:hypothetical protein